MNISKAFMWNKIAGNNTFNKELEIAMLEEEFNEYKTALEQDDIVEIVDAVEDMIFVMMGTMHKLGITPKQIEQCRDEVCRSNDSKFTNGECIRNEQGKIMKGEKFFRPDLGKYLLQGE